MGYGLTFYLPMDIALVLTKIEVSGFRQAVALPYCQLLHIDTTDLTDIGFCVVFQRAMVIKFTFKWDQYLKPVTSMLVGTSPELEIALYTLCFYTRPGRDCWVSLGGKRFKLKTHTYHNRSSGKRLFRSAYVVL